MTAQTELQVDIFNTFKSEPLTKEATLTSVNQGTFNASARSFSGAGSTNNDCYILYKPVPKGSAVPEEVEIKKTDKCCLLAANGVEPKIDDQVTEGGVTYTIIYAIEKSAGSKALFEILMR